MANADRDVPNERATADDLPAGCLRFFLYAVAVAFAMVVAFTLGSSRVASHCSECDMVFAKGLAWAVVTLVVLVLVIGVGEARLAARRRQQSGDTSQPDVER